MRETRRQGQQVVDVVDESVCCSGVQWVVVRCIAVQCVTAVRCSAL